MSNPTVELTRRRESKHHRRTNYLTKHAPAALASNDLLCFARNSGTFKHDCLVQVIKRHNKILQKRIADGAAVFTIILSHAFRIKDYGWRIDIDCTYSQRVDFAFARRNHAVDPDSTT